MAYRLPWPVRPVVERFALVVCPPELATLGIIEDVVAELEAMLGAMPSHLRLAVAAGFTAFDQGARLYPRARGRRFVGLDAQCALAYYKAVAHGPIAAQRKVMLLLKGIVTMAYFEQPCVLERLAYRPADYIATVTKRRLDSYGDDVRRGEEAVTAKDPDRVLVRAKETR